MYIKGVKYLALKGRNVHQRGFVRGLCFCFETLPFSNSAGVLIGQCVRFFHAWSKRHSTHTEGSNFELREIIFL